MIQKQWKVIIKIVESYCRLEEKLKSLKAKYLMKCEH